MTDDQWRQYIAHYHGLIAHVDTQVGRLLSGLQRRGLTDDTLVIFLSDHGEMMGSHHMAHKGPYMYEDVYAIPFITHWPGQIQGGRTHNDLFSTVDFTPTLGALCGVPVDAGAGLDQSAVLTRGETGTRDAIFAEYFGQGAEPDPGLMAIKSIRTHHWKLNLYLSDRSELYDLTADPHERTNLIDHPRHAQTRRRLTNRILHWLQETNDPLTQVFTNEFASA
jgi:arylsulfatase A-like enzyme